MRATLERLSPVLFAVVLAGGFVISSALPATADARDERRDRLHSVRPTAAPDTVAFVDPDVGAAVEQAATTEWYEGVALADWYEGVALADWYAGVERAQAEARAAAAAARGRSGFASSSRGSCGGNVDCFLACTRAHESDTSGGYGAVSPGGTYRGAYQFAQGTWNAAVAGAGWAEYSGMAPDQAPAAIQDAAAAHLYSVSGTQPWGGRC